MEPFDAYFKHTGTAPRLTSRVANLAPTPRVALNGIKESDSTCIAQLLSAMVRKVGDIVSRWYDHTLLTALWMLIFLIIKSPVSFACLPAARIQQQAPGHECALFRTINGREAWSWLPMGWADVDRPESRGAVSRFPLSVALGPMWRARSR
ncbi:hypothetical protein F4802DRAFT_388068 [Xylaria palmicola]|nr:hypothetical protein F4802DRAFT_388068 [Xylaria palmicola]